MTGQDKGGHTAHRPKGQACYDTSRAHAAADMAMVFLAGSGTLTEQATPPEPVIATGA